MLSVPSSCNSITMTVYNIIWSQITERQKESGVESEWGGGNQWVNTVILRTERLKTVRQ